MQVAAKYDAEVGDLSADRAVETLSPAVAGTSETGGQLGDRRLAFFRAGHAGPLWRGWLMEPRRGYLSDNAATGNVVA